MKQRGFVVVYLLIGILILAALVGVYYLGKSQIVNPQPQSSVTAQIVDETTNPDSIGANWKTYTNTKYNYAFRYPSNWFQGGDTEAVLIYNKAQIDSELDYLIEVYLGALVGDTTNIRESIGTKREIGDKIFEEKIADMQLDGKFAAKYRIDVLKGSQTDAKAGFLVRVDHNLGLLAIKINNPNQQNLKIFDQIISTFRFLDQANNRIKIDETGFSKRNFKTGDQFFSGQNYPSELINIKEDELVDIRCTPSYSKNSDSYSYYDNVTKRQEYIFDSNLITLIKEVKKSLLGEEITTFQYCETKQGTNLLEYEVHKGGGGMNNVAYFALVLPNKSIKKVTSIPNTGIPYFGCQKLLQWTVTDKVYYECGGGDGGFGASEIYVFDLMTGDTRRAIRCTGEANIEGGGSTIKCDQ